MVNCTYCNKEVKALGRSMHERYCSQNPNKLTKGHGGAKKGCTVWNTGLKTNESTKLKISNALIGKSTGKASTKEREELRKIKISKSMKNNPNAGGLRKGSGRGIKGTYKGYWCDSSWELAWVIYNLDHGINFTRNTTGFQYVYENSTHKYYPDFIVDDIYYEIKGRRSYDALSNKTKAKIDNFNGQLIVLYHKDMQPILEYVSNEYGKDFISLYDPR